MKLVTYRTQAHGRAGVLHGDSVLDLAACFSWLEHREGRPCSEHDVDHKYGRGVLGFVENASVARPAADELIALFDKGELPLTFDARATVLAAKDLPLLAPIPRPPSMRDGYAFRQHVETARRNRGLEMIPEFDQFPVFYFTNHQSVVGPGDVHVEPLQLERLDFELEAAVIIGKQAKNLTPENADDAIFGFTIMNDFSARVLQMEEMKLSLGPAKGKDFLAAHVLGPVVVTADELGDPYSLAMTATVNGEQWTDGSTSDMHWRFEQMIAYASRDERVRVGEVFGSGTVGDGSGTEHGRALGAGDLVELTVQGIGTLRNRVVAGRGAKETTGESNE